MKSRSDLVIVAAGDASLHTALETGREYDLWVVYYGDDDSKAEQFPRNCDQLLRRRGLKWEIVRSFSERHLAGDASLFEQYRYVLIPDDDLSFPHGSSDIQHLFESAEAVQAQVFQPAIRNENWSVCWEAMRQVSGSYCHAVNIVELMAPGFTGELFSRAVLPALNALEFQRAGWGIEPVITRFAEILLRRPVRTFVMDVVPMDHTRPVGMGTMSHQVGYDEAFLMPMIESNRMREHARFNLAEEARAFDFPFLLGNGDMSAIEEYMASIRLARSLLADFRQSRILRGAWKVHRLLPRIGTERVERRQSRRVG
jgi:hypothetical protein